MCKLSQRPHGVEHAEHHHADITEDGDGHGVAAQQTRGDQDEDEDLHADGEGRVLTQFSKSKKLVDSNVLVCPHLYSTNWLMTI